MKEMKISPNDPVLLVAAMIGVLIVALSLYALCASPLNAGKFDKEKAEAFKDLYPVLSVSAVALWNLFSSRCCG